MPTKMLNLAGQIGALGKGLPKHYKAEWKAGFKPMVEDMGQAMSKMVDAQFQRGQEPNGNAWQPYSPLTKLIYAATGRALQLGGTTMRRSFTLGKRGNFWRPTAKGFTYGSKLEVATKTHGKVNVAQAFGREFKIPKKAGDHEKAERVRDFMFATTGWRAPGHGKQLTHPARVTLYWTAAYQRQLLDISLVSLQVAIERAAAKTRTDVRAAATTQAGAQAFTDARRR